MKHTYLYWLMMIIMAITFGTAGALTLRFFQLFYIQNPIQVQLRCAICEIPTPTPVVKIKYEPSPSPIPTHIPFVERSHVMIQDQEDIPLEKIANARKVARAFPDDARVMVAVAMAESGLACGTINPNDSNGFQAVGLMQINDGRVFNDQDIANLTNCDHNLVRAKQKYRDLGKECWGAFADGRYKNYMWIYDKI